MLYSCPGNFYPRSPCGERRRNYKYSTGLATIISIHALLAESDFLDAMQIVIIVVFLSTLSLRRATVTTCQPSAVCCISIHALLAESDRQCALYGSVRTDFYPRSPCGERPIFAVRPYDAPIFLSTLSLRRATLRVVDGSKSSIISIHALLAESDALIQSVS